MRAEWYLCPILLLKMRRLLVFLAALPLCFSSCAAGGGEEARIERQLKKMTLREKIGQLFIVRPEAFDSEIQWTTGEDLVPYAIRSVNARMAATNKQYPVGGILLYGHNIDTPEQVKKFIGELRKFKGQPLICIDEEGGRVARIANNPNFNVPKYRSMAAIGSTENPQNAYNAAFAIGSYLKEYGFEIDFAPVADVNTNPENIIIGARAFSDNPAIAAPMVAQYVKGLQAAGIVSCLKHFPGHGDTYADTHLGYAVSHKTWEEMLGCEMLYLQGRHCCRRAHDYERPYIGTQSYRLGDSVHAFPGDSAGKAAGRTGLPGRHHYRRHGNGAITRQFSSRKPPSVPSRPGPISFWEPGTIPKYLTPSSKRLKTAS